MSGSHNEQQGDQPASTGYGKPPRSSQFRKGQSGNPKGRPRGRHNSEIPYDHVLGQMVTVREDGRQRRITAAEAFLLRLTQKGLAGDSAAARSSLAAIETARAKTEDVQRSGVSKIVSVPMQVECVLRTLGIATKKYPMDEKRVRWEINPWAVEAALARLGDRQLTEVEQREVWNCTRMPHKVTWPDWWTVKGGL
uniref:DUF5681 domain-containing protein n=1 Tax=uncultured Erythrobacter sp. TaxID=263913 RepID=UPI00262417F8|nr:DUF5681 domain-containing protein [uncultured Erythrobacter sp.]